MSPQFSVDSRVPQNHNGLPWTKGIPTPSGRVSGNSNGPPFLSVTMYSNGTQSAADADDAARCGYSLTLSKTKKNLPSVKYLTHLVTISVDCKGSIWHCVPTVTGILWSSNFYSSERRHKYAQFMHGFLATCIEICTDPCSVAVFCWVRTIC